MIYLKEAIKTGKPAGLKELGDWKTLYEGLASLPKKVKKSSDNDNLVDKLKNLKELLDSGALTKEEFEKAKKKLLN